LSSLIFGVLLAGVAGARLLYALEHWSHFASRPWAVLALWEGGLTLWGGILAAVPVGIWLTHRLGLPTWPTADVLAAPVALGAALGRLGCFLNGCCYGTPCDLPWGVRFPAGSEAALAYPGQALHPAQLYNAAAGLLVFGVVLAARPRLAGTPGRTWWLMLGLYASLRGIIDATRAYEPSARIAGLGVPVTESQAISLGLVVVSAVGWWLAGRAARRTA
jgi:phosphatidylglycerol:prolipoprotein diacylglycerol transferase